MTQTGRIFQRTSCRQRSRISKGSSTTVTTPRARFNDVVPLITISIELSEKSIPWPRSNESGSRSSIPCYSSCTAFLRLCLNRPRPRTVIGKRLKAIRHATLYRCMKAHKRWYLAAKARHHTFNPFRISVLTRFIRTSIFLFRVYRLPAGFRFVVKRDYGIPCYIIWSCNNIFGVHSQNWALL